MLSGYSTYRVEIKDEEFLAEDGRIYPRTAIITFYDKSHEQIGSEHYGAPETTEIYKMIEKGENLNLDNLFIKDFSLGTYRRHHGLGKKEFVELKSLSARNTFFESDIITDFSFSLFLDGDVSFEGALFARGKVSFNGSDFRNGNVIFSGAVFRDGNIDFAGSHFGDGNFLFKNVVLRDGIKDFQDISFGNGDISFANTEFGNGDILFINTHFGNGEFSFKVARIEGGKVDFHYSSFGNCDITFERAEFGDSRVDFRTVDFGSGKINFNRSRFGNCDINFEGAMCKAEKIQFKRVEIKHGQKNFNLLEMENTEVNFEKTSFGSGNINFNDSKFRVLSLKSCHHNNYVDLRVAKSELLDISDTIVRDIIDIEPYDFDVNISLINLTGMKLIGKINIDWERNRCEKIVLCQPETTLRQKAEQFRTLKQNFNSTGRYLDEDKAYVMFKRYESQADLKENVAKSRFAALWEYPAYAFKWLVFDKMGLYATSPGRVLISVIVFWFIFGTIYYINEITGVGKTMSSVGNPDNLSVLVQSYYHSAITFFTIGYGDVFPMGLTRFFSGLEGFIGVFIMSYFTVSFMRKVIR